MRPSFQDKLWAFRMSERIRAVPVSLLLEEVNPL